MRAIYKNNVLRPLKKLDLSEGEMVEISVMSMSTAHKFQNTLAFSDQNLIEEIAECDDFV
ncbi:MAG TPA: antitoxin family protein [Anaerovoracaceae bacterium]|nr:antitoxin family protein [Anaerovoracaceae bacterium]